MKATYNITNDKLKAWFDERLSKDNYDRMRRAGFTFWHGSKCFAAKWSPTAEDLIRELGIESIEADDQPDNVEARVERFQGYAEKAEQSAEASRSYLEERANTERRRENALNGIQKNLEPAEHWQERIAGAIRHAQYKERPDVIARRIEELEKARRKQVNDSTPDPKVDGARYGAPGQVWCGSRTGRGGFWVDKEKLPGIQAHAKRWIEHLDRRLEYERACLAAAGGIVAGVGHAPIDKGVFEIGGAIKAQGDWFIISKVNKKTVEVFKPACHWRNYWKVDRTEIAGVASKAEVSNAPENSELWHAKRVYDLKQREIAEVFQVERDHMPELIALCEAKGWGNYKHCGQDTQKQVIYMFLREQKGQVAA